MPRRSRSGNRGPSRRRRGFLSLVAGGLVIGSLPLIRDAGAYTSIIGGRTASVESAAQGDGIIGLTPKDSVKKNSQDPLVETENNYREDITITVTLDDGSDGTLTDPDGDTGTSVTFTLLAGGAEWIDLDAAVTGTIAYTVSATAANFDLSWAGSVEAESGNSPGAVDIRSPSKDQDFTALKNKDHWEIKTIDVRDNDGDNDLDRIEIEIREQGSGGTIVATKTIEPIPGDRYKPSGNPAATIYPDNSSYDVTNNTTYILSFKAYDADGNFASESLDDDT